MTEKADQKTVARLIELFSHQQYGDVRTKAKLLLDEYPDDHTTHNILASAYLKLGDKQQAYHHFRTAISIAPDYVQAHNNLAVAMIEDGDPQAAIDCLTHAVKIKPDFADAASNLSGAYLKTGRFKDAEKCARRAIELNPNLVSAHNNLGAALRETGRLGQAAAAFRNALQSDPDHFEATRNLGRALLLIGELEEALTFLARSLKLRPEDPEALVAMADYHRETGDPKSALECYQQAVSVDPDCADAQFGMGVLHLKSMNFSDAWPKMEFRWRRVTGSGLPYNDDIPIWTGEHASSLLIWKEQGVGDELMFNSCLPEIQNHCDRLIVTASRRLKPLFERSFGPGIEFVEHGQADELVSYEKQSSMLSALGRFRTERQDFQNRCPYLKPDPDLAERLSRQLGSLAEERPVIGISWRTDNPETGFKRSISLSSLVRALPPDAFCVNLQYGDTSDEVGRLDPDGDRRVHTVDEVDNFVDLESFAALISACGLVVSIDNSTAHFAGALGKECHVLLPFNAEWRWGSHGTEHSYWYRDMRLHWQTEPFRWDDALGSLKKTLAC